MRLWWALGNIMGICYIVNELAEAIYNQENNISPKHRLRIELLKLMPLYHEINDLSLWEYAIGNTYEDANDISKVELTLQEIYDFGRHNMYCAFNKESTRKIYHELDLFLNKNGYKNPIDEPDIENW